MDITLEASRPIIDIEAVYSAHAPRLGAGCLTGTLAGGRFTGRHALPGGRAAHRLGHGLRAQAGRLAAHPPAGTGAASPDHAGGERRDGHRRGQPGRRCGERSPIVGKTPTGMTPAVKSALEVISADLLAGCYARDEAVARLFICPHRGRSVRPLRAHRRPDRRAEGPDDETMAHVDAGCVSYGGSGATGDGTPVFYVGSGWADR